MIVNKLLKSDKIEFSLLDFGLRTPTINSLKIVEDVLEYAQLADPIFLNVAILNDTQRTE
nr:hypothetical protein [Mucilaginibacter sp. X5P1]